MTVLASRIGKLEKQTTGKGRCMVLKTGYGHTSEDVARVLRANGIVENRADTVVCLRTIYLDQDGNETPAKGAPELLSVN